MDRNGQLIHFGERNITLDIGNREAYPYFEKLGKALSSSVRVEILDLLRVKSMSVVEIANKLNIPVSSTAFHINCLEQAGLVITKTQPGMRGSMRISVCSVKSILISTSMDNMFPETQSIVVDMPVGHFYNCDVAPTCGMADENGLLNVFDNPKAFYSPNRVKAQLLWFQEGFIDYRFPCHYPCIEENSVQEISFSLELCSEAPGYQDVWPSDISIIINEVHCFTYRATGDFGSRRGKYTPPAWNYGSTQYGLLKTFSIRRNGAYLDEQPTDNRITIDSLRLDSYPYISFKIGIAPDAKIKGGINIFGEKYGDFPQNIIMRIDY